MLRTFDFHTMPIVDVANEIFYDAAKRGASDIHFDPYEDYLLVRIRIDGQLLNYTKVPHDIKDYLITRIKTVSKMNITEFRIPQDGAIKTKIKDLDLDMRVSCLPLNNGEKIVVRILDYSMSMAGLEELGFSEENYKKLIEMVNLPNGIILVTGATGSGKSTTVYSMLQYLNKPSTNLITVEDPVEMDITGINQVQVNSKVGLDFAAALRSILRQDPNVIMIGEIRDTETAKIAVRASITGHLVLSTIHTNNSLTTIERLIDMDVQRYLLASALEGVISQKLARRLCNYCKKLRPTTEYEKKIFRIVLGKDIEEVYDVVGCDKCNSGYRGRIPIHEVLRINQTIRDALASEMSKEQLRDLVYGPNVITMLQDGLSKVSEGLTTFSEILKIIELDEDDKMNSVSDFKEAVYETEKVMSKKEEINNDLNKVSNEKAQNKVNNTPIFDLSNVSFANQAFNKVNNSNKIVNNTTNNTVSKNIQPNNINNSNQTVNGIAINSYTASNLNTKDSSSDIPSLF